MLTGCGGEDPAATATPATTDTTAAAGATPGTTVGGAGDASGAAGGDSDLPGVNDISSSTASPGSAVKISAITPKAFSAAHCSKPIMVVLYQPQSILDEELLVEAKAAASSVKGVVSLIYTPNDVKEFGDLPSKLGLLATPGIATVGRDGTIENFWTTYVDRALIARSLGNAAASKPCSVTTDDAPAPGAALADAASLVSGTATTTGTTTANTASTSPSVPTVDAAGAGSAVPSSVPGSSAVTNANNLAADANQQLAATP